MRIIFEFVSIHINRLGSTNPNPLALPSHTAVDRVELDVKGMQVKKEWRSLKINGDKTNKKICKCYTLEATKRKNKIAWPFFT